MTEILKKFRAVVFATIALFLYLFGYRQAEQKVENQQMKGKINALKITKNARSNLSTDQIKRLLDKYKR